MDEKVSFLTDEQAMALAIHEAYKGAPYVSPNPLVGCVILDENNKLLATGYHHIYGGPHAEVDAFSKLSEQQLRNAQVFVTLEPCAHEGKTPSCAKALAKMPLKRVVFGLEDPNPLVAGQGADIIRKAGISCLEYEGDLKNDLEDVAEIFLKNYREKKVFVALKVAQTADGKIAKLNGDSKWITSEASREYVHELRARYDAILVGRNTIEVDDPMLNIRHPNITKINYLVILDKNKKLESSGKTYKFQQVHAKDKIIIANEFKDLNDLLDQLWKKGIRSVFIEGGAKTYNSFLEAGLVDRMYVFTAPVKFGEGVSAPAKLALKNVKHKTFGVDHFMTGKLGS
jgi:diaminohydroxyphosphoribosylaminopyrimidine deaminase / 5-amino-6-(5-phosphoribosylamino)uracil reductase